MNRVAKAVTEHFVRFIPVLCYAVYRILMMTPSYLLRISCSMSKISELSRTFVIS